MSRRYAGAGARSGTRREPTLARHRWAASLGPAPDEGQPGKGRLSGALLGDAPATGAPAEGSPDWDASGQAAVAVERTPATFRWRSGRNAAVLLAVISMLLAGWFWWQAVDGAPRVQPLGQPPGPEMSDAAGPGGDNGTVSDGAPANADPAAAGLPGATLASVIVVHVAGAVARPGVVLLPRGSRVHEAIKAAGGSTRTADLDRLNLAAILEDGQKILVPVLGGPDPVEPSGPSTATGGAGTSGSGEAPAGKINLNTADVEELATLPRVGPVLAQRIVDWRTQHGGFGRVEELDAVEGVGPKLLEALLPLVRV